MTVPIYTDSGSDFPAFGTIHRPVLVLGATGPVGQAVVNALLQAQRPVIAVAAAGDPRAVSHGPDGTDA